MTNRLWTVKIIFITTIENKEINLPKETKKWTQQPGSKSCFWINLGLDIFVTIVTFHINGTWWKTIDDHYNSKRYSMFERLWAKYLPMVVDGAGWDGCGIGGCSLYAGGG